jgi:type I restriction enzyme R subunit
MHCSFGRHLVTTPYNEVLDDVADQLAKLLAERKAEKTSLTGMDIDFEEKALHGMLKAISEKYEFPYPHDKLIVLSREVKEMANNKAKYTDWSRYGDVKAELKVDVILILTAHDYSPVANDEVFKEILEQAENFKKYAE